MPDASHSRIVRPKKKRAPVVIPPPVDFRATAPRAHWLTKLEVCKRLDCSERTVDRLAEEKKLEKRYRKMRGTGYNGNRRPQPIYNPDDVDRVEAERTQFVMPALPDDAANGHARSPLPADLALHPAFAQTVALLQHTLAPVFETLLPVFRELPAAAHVAPPVALPLWISIDDAAAVTGLSQSRLRRFVREGQLAAVRQKGGLRICREDLTQLRANDFARKARSAGR